MDDEKERYKKYVEFCMRNAIYGINPKENEKRIKEYFRRKGKDKNKQM